jgi:predicted aspartyl protease
MARLETRMRPALLTALVVALLAAPAAAELWKWTDADGVVRYANDVAMIPPQYRDTATNIGSPTGREEESDDELAGPTVIPFTEGGPIKAAVHLNGVPLTLMLDTGAERTVISPGAVARAGLDAEGGRAVRIVGVAGSTDAREVVVPLIDVAGARVGPLAVIVHDVGMAGVDGLLGRDILDRFTLTVDSAAGHAVLRPR